MRPRYVFGHEAIEEAGGEDVIAFAIRAALEHVRDFALEVTVEVRIEREIPHSLATGTTCLDEFRREFRAVREHTAHPLRQRIDTRAGERRVIHHETRLRATGEGEC